MKLRIITLLFCLPIFAFGQFNFNSSLDLVVGIDNNSIRYSRNNPDKLGYRFGLNYNKRLGEKIYLKSGLRGVNISFKSEKLTSLVWGSEIEAGIDAGTGPIFDPTLPHEIQYFYNYWFLEIPIIGRYEFYNSRWSPFVEMGISPNLYLKSTVREETDIGERNFSDGSDFNKFQVVGSVSLGVNFAATTSLQFFAQPVIRYHLTKAIKFPANEHIYNIGIEVGMRKRLK